MGMSPRDICGTTRPAGAPGRQQARLLARCTGERACFGRRQQGRRRQRQQQWAATASSGGGGSERAVRCRPLLTAQHLGARDVHGEEEDAHGHRQDRNHHLERQAGRSEAGQIENSADEAAGTRTAIITTWSGSRAWGGRAWVGSPAVAAMLIVRRQ